MKFPWAAVVSPCIALMACTSEPSSTSAVIGDEGGTVELGGARIEIPAGALPGDVTITIAKSDVTVEDALGGTLLLGPEGLTFALPVTVALPYDVVAAVGEEPVILTSPAHTTEFVSLGGTLVEPGIVTASTTHFSLFVPTRKRAPSLVKIAVTPPTSSIAHGTTKQLTATGMYTDHTTLDLTAEVEWSSSSEAVTVSMAGAATGVVEGAATVSAKHDNKTGEANVTVTAAELVAIEVTPTLPSIAKGTQQQFTATGRFTDNSTQDLTSSVAWSSSSSTATIDAAGLATGAAQGVATIEAALGGRAGSTNLTVTAATLVSLSVTTPSASLPKGSVVQLVATGAYTDASTQNLSAQVSWTSDASAISVSSTGEATAESLGDATVTAMLDGKQASLELTVTDAELVTIVVEPSLPSIAKGTHVTFTATGFYTDDSEQDLSSVVTWTSSDDAVASISNAAGERGYAVGLTVGTTAVTATLGTKSGSTSLEVTPATLVSLDVVSPASSVVVGWTLQLAANGTFTDGTVQDLTDDVTWTSSAPTSATVSNADGSRGLVSGVAPGAPSITATLGAASDQVALTVLAPVVKGVIRDRATNAPVANAQLFFYGGGYGYATTDANGRYAFTTATLTSFGGALSGNLYVGAPGYFEAPAMAIPDLGAQSLPYVKDATLLPGGTIVSGTVRDKTTNDPIAGASVSFGRNPASTFMGGSSTMSVQTAADGSYAIDSMYFNESALTGGFFVNMNVNAAGHFGGSKSLSFTTYPQVQDFTIASNTGPLLTGVIRDRATNAPIANAQLFFYGGGYGYATTDANGAYVFTTANLSSFGGALSGNLYVGAPGYFEAPAMAIPDLGAQSLPYVKDATLLPGGTIVSGTVRDKTTNEPIAGASVSFGRNPASTFMGGSSTMSVQTAADGSYAIDSMYFNESALTGGFFVNMNVNAAGFLGATKSASFTSYPQVQDFSLAAP